MRTRVMFDGHELSRDYYVSDLRDPLLNRTIGMQDVPGRDGSIFTGVKLAPKTISLRFTAVNKSMEARRAAGRRLAALLAVREPRPLQISVDYGLYYMAIPQSSDDAAQWVNATSFEVAFECPDPVAYGAERVITIPSGGSVTFEVGGTYQTMPVVEDHIAAGASNELWRLTLEDGSFLAYKPIYDGAIHLDRIVADCQARTLKENGFTRMLMATADWLVLTPGEHTLSLTGTVTSGPATVTFVERWL